MLDLHELTFIDSTGLSLLLDAERAARRHGASFAIADGSTDLERLLEVVGLSDHFARPLRRVHDRIGLRESGPRATPTPDPSRA